MSDRAPTMKVEHPNGYMVINASDFDPKKHKAIDEVKDTIAAIKDGLDELNIDQLKERAALAKMEFRGNTGEDTLRKKLREHLADQAVQAQIDALRLEAMELNIDYKEGWGVQKLQDEIAAAKSFIKADK